ncbi:MULTISPECIES: LrgB family protein [Solibacillus]|nr:LrgB family protein [Solibacillus faecavium]
MQILIIISTVALYILMNRLYLKINSPLLVPFFTVTVFSIAVLLIFNIPYETYMAGAEWIQIMLGPAVVSLAYPLYNQRLLINKYKMAIISSICIAMLTGLVSVYIILKLFKSSQEFIYTALPKSMTTPVAMQVSESIGGVAPLTAVLVMIAGYTGVLLGPFLYKIAKINTPISRGVAMGSVSHGAGVSKLKEFGEKELSIGSLSMGLSAIIGAIVVPFFSLLIM